MLAARKWLFDFFLVNNLKCLIVDSGGNCFIKKIKPKKILEAKSQG